MHTMLSKGAKLLATTVDENRRRYLSPSQLYKLACHCSFQTSLTQAFVWSVITPVEHMHAGPFPAAYHTGAHRCREQEALHILTSVYAAVVCISQQPLETPNALVCCVKQALILIWVTNKVTMQPSHVLTALPITAP